MQCGKCGRELAQNTKFCTGCGTPIRKRKLCPFCGNLDEVNKVYCAKCGTLLKTLWLSGTPLRRIPRISLYEGMPKVGIALGTGELTVCDDRLHFSNQLGDTMGDVFDAVGMANSAKKAKKNLFWEFPYDQIADVQQGKYAGMFTSIVIRLANGKTYSLAGSVSNDTMRSALQVLNEYMRYI